MKKILIQNTWIVIKQKNEAGIFLKVYDEFDNFYEGKKLYKAGKFTCPYCGQNKMSYYVEDKEIGKTFFLENSQGQKLCKECYVDFLRDEREKEKVAKVE